MRARLSSSFLVSLVALWASGCCFGSFAQGMALQGECDSVIGAANAATATVDAMPDPLAGIVDPTPQQIAASMEPMALAYEQAAAQLDAIVVTNDELRVQRDALSALYREAGATMRRLGAQMAAAMQTGDQAAIDRAVAEGDALGPREDVIIASLNAVCHR